MWKIIFFSLLSSLALLIILYFVFKLSTSDEKKAPEKEGEKKKVESKGKTDWPTAIASYLIVIGLFLYAYLCLSGINNPKVVVQNTTTQTKYLPNGKYGTLYWVKPDGVMGRDSQVRADTLRVEIQKNDADEMDFTVSYSYEGKEHSAKFLWNKREGSRGTWSQDYPVDNGTWYLLPSGEKTYLGEHTDITGSTIPFKLELN